MTTFVLDRTYAIAIAIVIAIVVVALMYYESAPTITSDAACTAAGGHGYATCDGTTYCCGPCTGSKTCASNPYFKGCACV
jgi:hypothetical protein